MKLWGIALILFVSQFAHATAEEIAISEMTAPSASSAKHWSFSLYSEFYMNQQEQHDKGSDARLTSLHWAGAKYAYDKTTTLSIVPIFELNSVPSANDRAKNTQDEIQNGKTFGGARFSDPFLSYAKTAGTIWGSDPLYTEVRYYLPASEVSRQWGSVGMLRFDYMMPWTVGPWTFSYYLNPRLYLEANDNSDHPTNFSFRQYAMASYNLNSTWSSYVMGGHRLLLKAQNFLKNDQGTYVFELGMTKTFTKNVAVTVYMDNLFQEGRENVNLFAAAKNDFTLATSLNF